jgi:16S rRNA (cytosine967-C5)-methyltransferase
MRDSLGDDLAPVAGLLRRRAPVFLRVNMARATRDQALAALAGDQIETVPHDLSATALEVTQNPRRVQQSKAFLDGLVELQDAASQAVIDLLPQGGRVLDYCAGGGGKALALAARGADVVAHDADPRRMRDIPIRAARAGVTIRTAQTADLPGLAPFDLVLCDAPCSGSGAWRRSPDGKWALTPERLGALCETQAAILLKAARLVGPGGKLAYATCSVLMAENGAQIQGFLARQSGWQLDFERQFSPLEGGDGFFACCLTRAEKQS